MNDAERIAAQLMHIATANPTVEPWAIEIDEEGGVWLRCDDHHRWLLGDMEIMDGCCFQIADFIVDSHNLWLPWLLTAFMAVVGILPDIEDRAADKIVQAIIEAIPTGKEDEWALE